MSKHPTIVWREVHWPRPLSEDTALELLQRVATETSLGTVRLEARASSEGLRWLIGLESPQLGTGTTFVRQLAGAIITKPTTARTRVTRAARVTLQHPALALTTDRVGAITRATLAALASAARTDDELVLQVVLGARRSPVTVPHNAADPRRPWLQLLTGTREAPSDIRASLRERASRHGFHVTLRVGAAAASPQRARSLAINLFGALRVAESAGTRLHLTPEHPDRLNEGRRPSRYPTSLSVLELLPLVGWPIGTGPLPGLPAEHPKKLHAPGWLRDGGRAFAQSNGPGKRTALGVPIQDACFHTLLIGPTGSGKSTAMLSLIEADMKAGRGLLLIDPKADLVRSVLERVPAGRKDDVIVIDPLSDRPVGFNPLSSTSREPELVADALLASLKGIFDNWGVRSEDVLTSSLITLARTPGSNLVWLPALLTDPVFRRRIVSKIDDPLGVGAYWARYDAMTPQQQAVEIGPALNKLRTFLVRPAMRTVLGQSESTFDLSEIFTKRKIVLVALNKGILGPEFARLLGSLLVGSLWPIILGRGALPPEKRTIASIFIDEVQDYLALPSTGDLSDALSQSRSLGAAFHVAHQYRKQLSPDMAAAIDTNARSKIVFGLEATDAAVMAKMAAELELDDFSLLPTYDVYATIRNGGRQSPWISGTTLPPSVPTSDPIEIRERSATRYGVPAEQVSAQLLRDLGLDAATEPSEPPTLTEPVGRKKRT